MFKSHLKHAVDPASDLNNGFVTYCRSTPSTASSQPHTPSVLNLSADGKSVTLAPIISDVSYLHYFLNCLVTSFNCVFAIIISTLVNFILLPLMSICYIIFALFSGRWISKVFALFKQRSSNASATKSPQTSIATFSIEQASRPMRESSLMASALLPPTYLDYASRGNSCMFTNDYSGSEPKSTELTPRESHTPSHNQRWKKPQLVRKYAESVVQGQTESQTTAGGRKGFLLRQQSAFRPKPNGHINTPTPVPPAFNSVFDSPINEESESVRSETSSVDHFRYNHTAHTTVDTATHKEQHDDEHRPLPSLIVGTPMQSMRHTQTTTSLSSYSHFDNTPHTNTPISTPSIIKALDKNTIKTPVKRSGRKKRFQPRSHQRTTSLNSDCMSVDTTQSPDLVEMLSFSTLDELNKQMDDAIDNGTELSHTDAMDGIEMFNHTQNVHNTQDREEALKNNIDETVVEVDQNKQIVQPKPPMVILTDNPRFKYLNTLYRQKNPQVSRVPLSVTKEFPSTLHAAALKLEESGICVSSLVSNTVMVLDDEISLTELRAIVTTRLLGHPLFLKHMQFGVKNLDQLAQTYRSAHEQSADNPTEGMGVRVPSVSGRLMWAKDPTFSVARHVLAVTHAYPHLCTPFMKRRSSKDPWGGLRLCSEELQVLVSRIASQPLPQGSPWQVLLVPVTDAVIYSPMSQSTHNGQELCGLVLLWRVHQSLTTLPIHAAMVAKALRKIRLDINPTTNVPNSSNYTQRKPSRKLDSGVFGSHGSKYVGGVLLPMLTDHSYNQEPQVTPDLVHNDLPLWKWLCAAFAWPWFLLCVLCSSRNNGGGKADGVDIKWTKPIDNDTIAEAVALEALKNTRVGVGALCVEDVANVLKRSIAMEHNASDLIVGIIVEAVHAFLTYKQQTNNVPTPQSNQSTISSIISPTGLSLSSLEAGMPSTHVMHEITKLFSQTTPTPFKIALSDNLLGVRSDTTLSKPQRVADESITMRMFAMAHVDVGIQSNINTLIKQAFTSISTLSVGIGMRLLSRVLPLAIYSRLNKSVQDRVLLTVEKKEHSMTVSQQAINGKHVWQVVENISPVGRDGIHVCLNEMCGRVTVSITTSARWNGATQFIVAYIERVINQRSSLFHRVCNEAKIGHSLNRTRAQLLM